LQSQMIISIHKMQCYIPKEILFFVSVKMLLFNFFALKTS
jgi:hypothetical protein